MENKNKNKIIIMLLWVLEGAFVGTGAILPGISGGALLVAFGMYRPIIETLSHPIKGLKTHLKMFIFFFAGVGLGFVGLSKVTSLLLSMNEAVVTAVFVGFILGTVPELWRDAGERGRTKGSYIALAVSFLALLGLLIFLKTTSDVKLEANTWGFIFCGILWGLSFIVPGLSSSSLLLFFGLYEPMLEGISSLSFAVIIPMGLSMVASVLLLSRVMEIAFKKCYSILTHSVLGFVLATTVMIIPPFNTGFVDALIYTICIAAGAAVSFFFSLLCERMKVRAESINGQDEDNSENDIGDFEGATELSSSECEGNDRGESVNMAEEPSEDGGEPRGE